MNALLVIDSFDREFLSMRLLKDALVRRGVTVRLCSRPILAMVYNRFKPQVVVLPKTHKIPELEHIHRSAVVILMQAESFVGSLKAFELLAPKIRKNFVDITCCWGDFDREFYVGAGIFPAERTYATGHPITEAWYLPRVARPADNKLEVGITFSLRALTHKALGPNPNPIEAITGLEGVGDSGFFVPPYHAEDWVAFEASWLRIAYQLVKENPDISFSLRPHPIENSNLYKVFEKKFPNVRVAENGHISQWLSTVDAICSAYSTSMLDAYFSGVSVLSIRNLISPRIIAGIHPGVTAIPHEKHFPGPTSFAEMRKSLLKPWSVIPELDALGQRVFNFSHGKRPSERVADLIVGETPTLQQTKARFAPILERTSERVFGPFSWSPDLRMVMLHLRDTFGRTQTTSSAYCKHRLIANRRFDAVYDALAKTRLERQGMTESKRK